MRLGPVRALPGVDELANTGEFFVHTEDVRRANGLPLRELKAALRSELNAGAIAGAQSEDERDDAWYAAARAAIDDIELGDPMRDNCFPTLDMGDPHDPDSGWYDDVRAYFVFVAVD